MLSSMRFLSLMLLSLVSCGGGPVGPGQFTGTVAGNSLSVKDTLLVGGKEIWLSSTEKLCEKLSKNTLPKAGTIVKFTPNPVAAGDFTVDPSTGTAKPDTVFVQFFKLDDTCTNTVPFGESLGTSGTVKLTTVTDGGTTGTFDVTFGSTDKTSGSFTATFCNAPTTYPTPECK